jgi:hypothetical protein
MRKYSVIIATTLLALELATGANAMTTGAPAGMRTAVQEAVITEKIYWGWRPYYAPVYVAPPIYVVRPVVVVPPVYAPVYWRPRYYARPYFWGGPRFYGRRFYGW